MPFGIIWAAIKLENVGNFIKAYNIIYLNSSPSDSVLNSVITNIVKNYEFEN